VKTQNTYKSPTWLHDLGESFVQAPVNDRATLMREVVTNLVQDEITSCRDSAWFICAEAYANALVIEELKKFIDGIGEGKTVSI
jgi:hypothetical protein